MKRIILMLLVIGMHIPGLTIAQTVSISGKAIPLQKLFKTIEQQTGYVFFYNEPDLLSADPVTLDVKNVPLKTLLDQVLKGQPFQYVVKDKTVIVSKKMQEVERKEVSFVTGEVKELNGKPLSGATVSVKGKAVVVVTDTEGRFSINAEKGDLLLVSYVGMGNKEVRVKEGVLEVVLGRVERNLDTAEVVVKGSTGYQVIDKNHPGSFDVIDNKLLNRKISTDIMSRIENLTPGVLFDKTPGMSDPLLIRGRNTIYSTTIPLIVLDNFPYDGDLNNINPNDIENITILKDAAAASIWGARAGNGVIVLTTKKGRSAKPQVTIISNLSIQERPDLFYSRVISGSDYIDVEKFLFDKGHYNGVLNAPGIPQPLTPAIELFAKARSGQISAEEAVMMIDKLRENDVRKDLKKYFYKNASNQQNALSVSGNTSFVNYYLSAGWDRNTSNIVGEHGNRITLRTNNSFKVSNAFQITAGLNYVRNSFKKGNSPSQINSNGGKMLYPYADLVDDAGNGLTLVKKFRMAFADTVGKGKLLDWTYNPYNEINATEDVNSISDLVLNTGLKYAITPFLTVNMEYQYENQIGLRNSLNKVENFTTRDVINTYYQPNATIKFPVPVGGIMTVGSTDISSHQGRIQLSYNQNFGKHSITAIGGWEIKNSIYKTNSYQLYGYNEEGMVTNPNMDFVSLYPIYLSPGSSGRLPMPSQMLAENIDRFISSYLTATYIFDDRHTVYASAREDAANLFGVRTNQRGVPLWSVGYSWQLSKEQFYRGNFLPYLRLRADYGYSGNYNRRASAYTIIEINNPNILGANTSKILNPPNKDLRWERNGRFNVGVDFGIKNHRISGTIEYYRSKNIDLVADAPIDPTLGLTRNSNATLLKNVASVDGKGFEVNITSKNIDRSLKWSTSWIFSYASTKISKFLIPAPTMAVSYVSGDLIPIERKPMYAIYSYAWAGLDPATGDPRGYNGKDISKDYYAILNDTKPDDLYYSGQRSPPIFGAILNTFTWRGVTVSFNTSYKLGYYFRRNSISYNALFSSWTGHSDYALAWKKPGDESHTIVPSMVYPVPSGRDAFYQQSSVLVEKGDHVRLEDFQIKYTIAKSNYRKWPAQQISIYSYTGNLNLLLWRANRHNIDPYFSDSGTSLKEGKTFAFGLNIVF